ncbi:Uncharacterised protein [Mycobacterium tuberculosis]|nr:Uncharacterised protein [Mycobacterium tuberculosis]
MMSISTPAAGFSGVYALLLLDMSQNADHCPGAFTNRTRASIYPKVNLQPGSLFVSSQPV